MKVTLVGFNGFVLSTILNINKIIWILGFEINRNLELRISTVKVLNWFECLFECYLLFVYTLSLIDINDWIENDGQ